MSLVVTTLSMSATIIIRKRETIRRKNAQSPRSPAQSLHLSLVLVPSLAQKKKRNIIKRRRNANQSHRSLAIRRNVHYANIARKVTTNHAKVALNVRSVINLTRKIALRLLLALAPARLPHPAAVPAPRLPARAKHTKLENKIIYYNCNIFIIFNILFDSSFVSRTYEIYSIFLHYPI
jgi:hypothetical protein